jgi:outer membrane protein insertion porin family
VNTGQGIGGRSLPVFKYFQGGGLGSVRGFQQGTLGGETCILDASQACPVSPSYSKVGGTSSAFANFELSAPFPGAGNDRTLRMFGFLDAGTVYCKETATIRCDSNAMRASSGFGISWISPVGPLRLAWAKPIASQPTDLLQNFQFQIGTSF